MENQSINIYRGQYKKAMAFINKTGFILIKAIINYEDCLF